MGVVIPSNKKGRKIRPFDAFAVLFFLKTEFFLQIVDVSATMLEVLVIHDADCRSTLVLIPSMISSCSAFFMRAIATSRFSP